jgi:hypothetical protein
VDGHAESALSKHAVALACVFPFIRNIFACYADIIAFSFHSPVNITSLHTLWQQKSIPGPLLPWHILSMEQLYWACPNDTTTQKVMKINYMQMGKYVNIVCMSYLFSTAKINLKVISSYYSFIVTRQLGR